MLEKLFRPKSADNVFVTTGQSFHAGRGGHVQKICRFQKRLAAGLDEV
jgi:hypothetical protein